MHGCSASRWAYLLLTTHYLLLTTYCLLPTLTTHYLLLTICYRWVLCLSMGPGACLEGLVLRPPRKLLPELLPEQVGAAPRGAFGLDPTSLERHRLQTAAAKERLRLSDSGSQRPRPTGPSAQHAARASLHRSSHGSAMVRSSLESQWLPNGRASGSQGQHSRSGSAMASQSWKGVVGPEDHSGTTEPSL